MKYMKLGSKPDFFQTLDDNNRLGDIHIRCCKRVWLAAYRHIYKPWCILYFWNFDCCCLAMYHVHAIVTSCTNWLQQVQRRISSSVLMRVMWYNGHFKETSLDFPRFIFSLLASFFCKILCC